LRQSIVVAKPVRHKNPARVSAWRLLGGRNLRAVRSPSRFVTGTVSRQQTNTRRGSRNILGEIF
jgi:hypothetical protein